MSEQVIIEPKHIGDFVEWLGLAYYHEMGGSTKAYEKMKGKEREEMRGMVKIVAESISKGLILSKRQPELADAHIQFLNSERPGYADELLNRMLNEYQPFLFYMRGEETSFPQL